MNNVYEKLNCNQILWRPDLKHVESIDTCGMQASSRAALMHAMKSIMLMKPSSSSHLQTHHGARNRQGMLNQS